MSSQLKVLAFKDVTGRKETNGENMVLKNGQLPILMKKNSLKYKVRGRKLKKKKKRVTFPSHTFEVEKKSVNSIFNL